MSDIDMNSYDSEYYSKKKTAFTTNKKIKSFNPFIPNSINKTITKFNNMDISIIAEDDKEYVTITSNSMEELLSKVQAYSYELASERVMTDAERMLGSHIDFKG